MGANGNGPEPSAFLRNINADDSMEDFIAPKPSRKGGKRGRKKKTRSVARSPSPGGGGGNDSDLQSGDDIFQSPSAHVGAMNNINV